MAASTASTPASTAARTVAADIPDVSWVWKWMGRPVFFAQRLEQDFRRGRLQQASHILDGDDMRAGLLSSLQDWYNISGHISGGPSSVHRPCSR